MDLEKLGWDSSFEEHFKKYTLSNFRPRSKMIYTVSDLWCSQKGDGSGELVIYPAHTPLKGSLWIRQGTTWAIPLIQ